MINPNRNTSEDVLWRLKEASYERLRVNLKCSIELLMSDFNMTYDDLCSQLKTNTPKKDIIQGKMSLKDLNALAHVFSCEPYVLFRPRNPWVQT